MIAYKLQSYIYLFKRKTNTPSRWLVFLAAVTIIIFCQLSLFARPAIQKVPRLNWRSVPDAATYQIEIKKGGTQIIKRKITNNSFDAPITHGVYEFRITAYDSSNNELGQSSWETVVIESWKLVSRQYIYIGIGISWDYVAPVWNTFVKNSWPNFHFYGAYDLPIQNLSVEGQFEYQTFENQTIRDKVETDFTFYSLHAGLFYSSRMNDLISAGIRFAPGVTYTNMEITDVGEVTSYSAPALSYIVGFGIRANYSYGFIEHGIEFKHILLTGETFKEIRPYLRIGGRY